MLISLAKHQLTESILKKMKPIYKPILKIQPLLILMLLVLQDGLSQNVAFTTETSTRGGILYYNSIPFTGELYEFNDNAKTDCSCTLKAFYTDGRLDGKTTLWYVTGRKKYEGLFNNGQKEGTHRSWTATGTKEFEKKYYKDQLISQLLYYPSERRKEIKEWEQINNQWMLKQIQIFADSKANTLIKEENFKHGKPHGQQLLFKDTGEAISHKTYSSGELIESIEYFPNGAKKSKSKKEQEILRFEGFYENGKTKETGFFKNELKDSIWINYDMDGNRLRETAYNKNIITRVGDYANNKKNGEWNYYLKNNTIQKTVTYDEGTIIKEMTITLSHLVKNQIKDNTSTKIYQFQSISGPLEIIIMEGDHTQNSNKDNISVFLEIQSHLENRLTPIRLNESLKNTALNKKIQINDIEISYKESLYALKSGGTEKGYDAFISFSVSLLDPDNNVLDEELFKINKSDKILSSIFNTLVATYAKNPKTAFERCKKEIDISDFLKRHFPISEDYETKKKSKKKRN